MSVNNLFKRRQQKLGMSPGQLIYLGEERSDRVEMTLMDYDETSFEENRFEQAEDLLQSWNENRTNWMNVDGLHETDILDKIGKRFNIHPLVLEDILNSDQRPKYEDYEDYIFIVVKMIVYNEKAKEIESEQVSFILGENYLITFQEKKGNVFDSVRNRIKMAKGRVRKWGVTILHMP